MKKGFTLVELIAVIALLAIVSGAAAASYVKVRQKQKNDAYNAIKVQFENAAIEYAQKGALFHYSATCVNVTYQDLLDSGTMTADDSNPLKDPRDDSTISTSTKIKVEYNNGNYIATFRASC